MHNHSFRFLSVKAYKTISTHILINSKGKEHFIEENTLFLCSSTFTIHTIDLASKVCSRISKVGR